MTLTNTAYLEIEGDDTTATFEFESDLEVNGDLTKSYLMGEQGQYIREIYNQSPATGSFDGTRRTGFWLDGGAGDWAKTVNFSAGPETTQWGDTSGGTGESNVTVNDASGENVAAVLRENVLEYWIAKTKSDSGADTRLHFGSWTDGSISYVSGVSAGAHNQPMPIAIKNISTQIDVDRPGELDCTLQFSHVSTWDNAPDWVNSVVGTAIESAGQVFGDA